jgi:hypothetical protein
VIPDQWTLNGLEAVGFKRCGRVADLHSAACASAPDLPGVYVVLRETETPPTYLKESTGGHFKGKDPTVQVAVLEKNWVVGTGVLYVGKAGGSEVGSTLRKRLRQYMKFGNGSPVGHWGGRFIWQLADHNDLLVLYKLTAPHEPSEYEAELISAFTKANGKRPFANLMG